LEEEERLSEGCLVSEKQGVGDEETKCEVEERQVEERPTADRRWRCCSASPGASEGGRAAEWREFCEVEFSNMFCEADVFKYS
jgi:hypothetical protein